MEEMLDGKYFAGGQFLWQPLVLTSRQLISCIQLSGLSVLIAGFDKACQQRHSRIQINSIGRRRTSTYLQEPRGPQYGGKTRARSESEGKVKGEERGNLELKLLGGKRRMRARNRSDKMTE